MLIYDYPYIQCASIHWRYTRMYYIMYPIARCLKNYNVMQYIVDIYEQYVWIFVWIRIYIYLDVYAQMISRFHVAVMVKLSAYTLATM